MLVVKDEQQAVKLMRILIIEDEKRVASFIKKGLEEERFAVDVAYDGKDGFNMASVNEYDLILLDLMLPTLDGITLCRRLREEKKRDVPILMLTAKGAVMDKIKGLNVGADDYLTKPFDFAELVARIRALMRRGRPAQALKLQVADLMLDPVSHKVKRADKEIDLTPKEYALLEYIMGNAGEVVTRTMISEHVWNFHFDNLSNVIDVYVNYLRRKIEEGFEKKLIHTVRGIGYVIKED